MTSQFLRLSFVAGLTLLLIQSSVSAQTQLRWKFAKGQVLNHQLSQDADTSMNVGGNPITTKMVITMNTVWTVNAVDAQGTADVTQSFKGIKFKMNSPLFSTEFDSASPNEPTDPISKQMSDALKPLADAKFNFKINSRGEIQDVKPTEETEKALQSVQLGGPAGALSKDGLIAMVKDSVIPFPENPVQKGSSWQHKSEMKAPPLGSMTNESTLTYEGPSMVDGKQLEVIKIVTKSKLMTTNANPAVQVSLKEQAENGALFFDNQAGRLSHSEATQNMVMEIATAGQKFDQSLKTVKKVAMTAEQQ